MAHDEAEIWSFLERHLQSVFDGDWETYQSTTAADLSLYEYWVLPHRQDGIAFHQFMIENRWMGEPKAQRFDLFEKRCQIYGDTAVVTYTFLLSQIYEGEIRRHAHNETRVLVHDETGWKVVHVHKSPSGQA